MGYRKDHSVSAFLLIYSIFSNRNQISLKRAVVGDLSFDTLGGSNLQSLVNSVCQLLMSYMCKSGPLKVIGQPIPNTVPFMR